MNRSLLLLGLLMLLARPALAQEALPGSGPSNAAAAKASAPATPEEKQELHAAREKVLQENPDLAAEQKDLHAKLEELNKKIDALVIKEDPKAAEILAKHPHAGGPGHGPGGPGGPPPPPPAGGQ